MLRKIIEKLNRIPVTGRDNQASMVWCVDMLTELARRVEENSRKKAEEAKPEDGGEAAQDGNGNE